MLWYAQNSRKIVAHFNGGNITSDAGGLLLQQAERVTGIISQFAARTSAGTMRANQLRLWFSSVAYTLLNALRRLGLKGTEPAKARCDTIRLKLLKIGAQIKVTVRKVWVCLRATRIEEFSGRCMKISTGFVPFGCDGPESVYGEDGVASAGGGSDKYETGVDDDKKLRDC